jgi:hypothetical protein
MARLPAFGTAAPEIVVVDESALWGAGALPGTSASGRVGASANWAGTAPAVARLGLAGIDPCWAETVTVRKEERMRTSNFIAVRWALSISPSRGK